MFVVWIVLFRAWTAGTAPELHHVFSLNRVTRAEKLAHTLHKNARGRL